MSTRRIQYHCCCEASFSIPLDPRCVCHSIPRDRNGEGAPQTWRGALTHSDALHWNPELLSMCFCYLLHPSQGASATVKLLFRYAGASKHLECVQTERERERVRARETEREHVKGIVLGSRNWTWSIPTPQAVLKQMGNSKAQSPVSGCEDFSL